MYRTLLFLILCLTVGCSEQTNEQIKFSCISGSCEESMDGVFNSMTECENECSFLCEGTVTDIDGNEYEILTIGNHCWMVENLKVTKYANGDSIIGITGSDNWSNIETGAWCWYNNDSTLEAEHGKLYNGYVASDERGICPNGWRLPTYFELKDFDDLYGGFAIAGGAMKTRGFEFWDQPNEGATNESGFNGKGSGTRNSAGMFLNNFRKTGAYWTSTVLEENSLTSYGLIHYDERISYGLTTGINAGLCVRCIKE